MRRRLSSRNGMCARSFVQAGLLSATASTVWAQPAPIVLHDAIGPDPWVCNGRGVVPNHSIYPIAIHQAWFMAPTVIVPPVRTRLLSVEVIAGRIGGEPNPAGCGGWEVHIWSSLAAINAEPCGSDSFYGDVHNALGLNHPPATGPYGVGVYYTASGQPRTLNQYLFRLDLSGRNVILEAGEDYALSTVSDDGGCQPTSSYATRLCMSPLPGPIGEAVYSRCSGPYIPSVVDNTIPPTDHFAYRIIGEPVCCPADFNCSGTVTVQDLFDYLAAYFTPGSLAADVNDSGTVTVQDLFDYLAIYFTPCV